MTAFARYATNSKDSFLVFASNNVNARSLQPRTERRHPRRKKVRASGVRSAFAALAAFLCTAQLAPILLGAQQMAPEQAAERLKIVKAEYRRPIALLEEGYKNGWTQEKFQRALNAKPLRSAVCDGYLQMLLRPYAIWDERPPFNVELRQVLTECIDDQRVAVQLLALRAEGR